MQCLPWSLCVGDDEQSDWFFEGDCGVGSGVAGMLPGWDSDNQLSLEDNRPSPTFLQPARPSQRGRGRCLLCFRHTFVFTPAVERFEPVFLLCHCPWGQLKLKGHFVIFYVLNNIRVSLVLHDIFSLNSLFFLLLSLHINDLIHHFAKQEDKCILYCCRVSVSFTSETSDWLCRMLHEKGQEAASQQG